MPAEENKAVVRRFFEDVINGGNLQLPEELLTADYVQYQELPGAKGAQGIGIATIHNLVQTLSVKLDSVARYGIYHENLKAGGAG